jgi:hypothetical protein
MGWVVLERKYNELLDGEFSLFEMLCVSGIIVNFPLNF